MIAALTRPLQSPAQAPTATIIQHNIRAVQAQHKS